MRNNISGFRAYALPEHIEAMRLDISSSKRFKPEEVVAASISGSYPITFAAAEELAVQIMSDVNSAFC